MYAPCLAVIYEKKGKKSQIQLLGVGWRRRRLATEGGEAFDQKQINLPEWAVRVGGESEWVMLSAAGL